MNREHGYTLIETLLTMVVVVILGASELYGWQSWQRQQRLWQTACQVRLRCCYAMTPTGTTATGY